MRLSTKAIKEFQQTYQSVKGTPISEDEANKKGVELLNFMVLIYRQIPLINKAYFEQLKEELNSPMYTRI